MPLSIFSLVTQSLSRSYTLLAGPQVITDKSNAQPNSLADRRINSEKSRQVSFFEAMPVEVVGEISRHLYLPPPAAKDASKTDKQATLGEYKTMSLAVPGFWSVGKSYSSEIQGRIGASLAKDFVLRGSGDIDQATTEYLLHTTSFDLGGLCVGSDMHKVARLAQVLALVPSLQTLDLGENNLGSAEINRLPLAGLRALTTLNLSGNRMGAAALEMVPFAAFGQLRSLDLSHNLFGPAGAKSLNLAPLNNLDSISKCNASAFR